jgi:hypothetical protein
MPVSSGNAGPSDVVSASQIHNPATQKRPHPRSCSTAGVRGHTGQPP